MLTVIMWLNPLIFRYNYKAIIPLIKNKVSLNDIKLLKV